MDANRQTQIWVENARHGEELALSKLLAALHPALKAKVVSRLDSALRARLEPDDILQQVYMQVFRTIGGFDDRGPGSFKAWVETIVDNKITDARRSLHRKARDVAREQPGVSPGDRTDSYVNLLEQVYADTQTPSRVIRRDEAVGALMACLSHLSDTHRRVLHMRFLEGRSVEDVADVMAKTEGAIVALTKRALLSLRASMDRVGEFTHGG